MPNSALKEKRDKLCKDGVCKLVNVAVFGAGGSGQVFCRSCGDDSEWTYDPTECFPLDSTVLPRDGVSIKAEWEEMNAMLYGQSSATGRVKKKNCDFCVFVYSCTSRYSFQELEKMWERFVVPQDDTMGTTRFLVLSNKLDLFEEFGAVSLAEGRQWSITKGASFRGVSAKTGEGFEGLSTMIVQIALDAQSARREGATRRFTEESASESSEEDFLKGFGTTFKVERERKGWKSLLCRFREVWRKSKRKRAATRERPSSYCGRGSCSLQA